MYNCKKAHKKFTFFVLSAIFTVFSVNNAIATDQLNTPETIGLSVATFDIDATPPVGNYLTFDPEKNTWDLGLRARGIVLLGAGNPIVLCSIDWIGIANGGQDEFKKSLAEAAGTTTDRVAVHTVHQHDAPECDFDAERVLKEAGLNPLSYEGSFARQLIGNLNIAVKQSLKQAQPVTRLGLGKAKVYKVASNRRIIGKDGNPVSRYSACKDPKLRAEPIGLIDPVVSLISFWNEDKPIAVLSYYATHPQSYYRTGVANPDFPGIARFMRQLDVPQALHIHFNGAGGNIVAGKFNDGSMENRGILAKRLADGMKKAWKSTRRESISAKDIKWLVEPVELPVAKNPQVPLDKMEPVYKANNVSKLVWQERVNKGKKIDLTCLEIGRARIIHLPGEPFVEYQLAAKAMRPDLFVAVAGYGDYAPGYICTAAAYKEGGYEAGQASGVTPEAENILLKALHKLLDKK
jgi:hypothetical protein